MVYATADALRLSPGTELTGQESRLDILLKLIAQVGGPGRGPQPGARRPDPLICASGGTKRPSQDRTCGMGAGELAHGTRYGARTERSGPLSVSLIMM